MSASSQRKSPQGPRHPKQARSRRTRERILEAAVASFEQRGYDETTTTEIARRARIGVGTFYGYFKDKRSILLELLHGTVEQIADHVVQGLDPEAWRGRDPRFCVRSLIDAVFHTRSFQPGMQLIVWERYFKDSDFRAAAEAIEKRVRAALEDLLAVLKTEGRIRIHDLRTSSFLIHATVQWTTTRLMLGSSAEEIDAAVDAASDMISRFLFDDSLAPEPAYGT